MAPQDERAYRGTSLIRNCLLLGPYSRTMPRALWRPSGGGGRVRGHVRIGHDKLGGMGNSDMVTPDIDGIGVWCGQSHPRSFKSFRFFELPT